MELKYTVLLIVGILLSIAFLVLYIVKRRSEGKYKGGIKVANTYMLELDDYYKRKVKIHKVLQIMMVASLILSMVGSFWLMARPYEEEITPQKQYNRDIILCLDISTSVDELNMQLVDQLKEVVNNLQGERFGIIIFNTSPILMTPLTDDYEFINEQLESIRHALDMRIDQLNNIWGSYPDDYYYYNSLISEGTLVGNTERGSSLIGDGLASTVANFTADEKRSRTVIFATDNDPQGDGYFTLQEAADYCAKNHVKVFGIGTKEMSGTMMGEMQTAVESTGGAFYLQEDSGTVGNIVSEISKQTLSKIEGKKIVRQLDQPGMPFAVMLIGMLGLIISIKLLKE